MTPHRADPGPTGEGPVVVLLHPLGVDGSVWTSVASRLGGFRTISYDLPGHGVAAVPAPWSTVGDYAEQLAGFLTSSGLGAVHVVGVSLGGLVAQALALDHPALVDRLVLVDCVATYPVPMKQMWRERAELVRTQGMRCVLDATLDLWFTAEALQHQTPPVGHVRQLLLAADPEGYARVCEALATADTTQSLSRIAAPTLVICGDDDAPAFTLAAPRLAEEIPDARLAWLDARHGAAFERPGAMAELLRGFLTR